MAKKPTTQDSLLLYNNQLLKDKFYKNNPNYAKLNHKESSTSNKDIKSLVQQILNKDSSKAINYLKSSDIGKINENFVSMVTKQNLLNRFGKVTDNVYSSGDILSGELDGIFNPNAPASYFSPTILPQKWNTYGLQQNTSIHQYDVTDVPMYDPIAVKPVSMLTPAEKKEREKKYPNSFGESSDKPVKVPIPSKNFINLKEKLDILGDNVQYQNEPESETNQNSTDKNKGNPVNDFLTQTVKTPNGMKIYKRKDRNSDWIEQYKYGGRIKKYTGGGIIGADGKPEANSGGGMGAGAITGMVGNALDTVGNFIPVDNDGHGVSKRGQAISGGIQTGLDSAADIANSIPGGQIIGGALKIGSFLTKGITAIVDAVKEHKNPTDELVNEKYSPTHKDSAFSFGMEHLALGGNVATDSQKQFKQYDTVSHAEGGQNIDANNNPTSNPNNAKAEIEKKENSYKNYVFSDELGFAKMAKKINDKYKDREDLISKNTLDIELTGLMKKNEAVKKQIEQNQQIAQQVLEFGGLINKRKSINAFNDMENNSIYSSDGKFFSNENQYQKYQNFYNPQELTQPIINNYGKTKFKNNKFQFKYGGIIPKAILGLDLIDELTNTNKDKTELSDYIADNNGVAVPPPNVDLNEAKSDAEFYKPGQVGTPIKEDDKKQVSPEAIAGYGIKGIEMLGHAIQAFKKPDLVNPVYNPEENKIKSLMSNRKIDMQSVLDELDLQETATKQNINDNSTSVGVKMANLQKANANQVNAIANTKIQEQQTNNQYRADEAQVLNSLGAQKVQAQTYAEDLNARAKGNVQNQRDKFLKESIGGLGDFLLKKDYVNKENQFQVNVLKQKGINFTVNDDWKAFSKAGVDLTKFDGEIESIEDKTKRQAKLTELESQLKKSGVSDKGVEEILTPYKNKYIK